MKMQALIQRALCGIAPVIGLASMSFAASVPDAAGADANRAIPPPANIVNIAGTGAKADGATLNTAAIQAAIDRCFALGGGTVYIPPGRWLSGGLILKSNVTLYLEAGAVLIGSTKIGDYPEITPGIVSSANRYTKHSLIYAEGAENIAIRGAGAIDGQGEKHPYAKGTIDYPRPFIMRIVKCTDVLVENVRLRSSVSWMQHYLGCERVIVRGIRVFNHSNRNNDGINIDGCRDVVVSDSVFDSDDDAFCLKQTSADYPNENIRVSNCVMSSHCAAIKFGSETIGDCRNVTISNCTILSPRYTKSLHEVQPHPHGRVGIEIHSLDGSVTEGIVISNVTIRGAISTPLHFRLQHRGVAAAGAKQRPIGALRNVIISNVVATGGGGRHASAFVGTPGHPIENVTLANLRFEYEGGGTEADAKTEVPALTRKTHYASDRLGTVFPSYGFFMRDVAGVRLSNVHLIARKADARPAVIMENAGGIWVDGKDIEPALPRTVIPGCGAK